MDRRVKSNADSQIVQGKRKESSSIYIIYWITEFGSWNQIICRSQAPPVCMDITTDTDFLALVLRSCVLCDRQKWFLLFFSTVPRRLIRSSGEIFLASQIKFIHFLLLKEFAEMQRRLKTDLFRGSETIWIATNYINNV